MEIRTLVRREGSRSLFWEVTWEGCEVELATGEMGSDGEVQIKRFATPTEAREFVEEQIDEKLDEGYSDPPDEQQKQTARPSGAASNPELEEVIERNPDDPEAYLVYADWLQTCADPRGELIVLQHALSTQTKASPTEELRAKEARLLERHRSRFFGALSDNVDLVDLSWQLGFVRTARLFVRRTGRRGLDDASLLGSFLAHSSSRFLQRLIVHKVPAELWGDRSYDGLVKGMTAAGQRDTLRSLQLGLPEYGGDCRLPQDLWRIYPGLEELALFCNAIELDEIDLPWLKRFVLEGWITPDCVRSLARSRWPELRTMDLGFTATLEAGHIAPLMTMEGMPQLKHLGLQMTSFDESFTEDLCRMLARSQLLGQLETLDLSKGSVNEAGVQALIDHRDAFAHLTSIDLTGNGISEQSLKQLERELRPSPRIIFRDRLIDPGWADYRYELDPAEIGEDEDDEDEDEEVDSYGEWDDSYEAEDFRVYAYAEEEDLELADVDEEPGVDDRWEDLDKESPFDDPEGGSADNDDIPQV